MGDVLLTGASGGIGSALVPALASAGHRVIAVGRDAGGLHPMAARHDGHVTAVPGERG
jgi:uncharacterized protein YbjT (DUF2867 family)